MSWAYVELICKQCDDARRNKNDLAGTKSLKK